MIPMSSVASPDTTEWTCVSVLNHWSAAAPAGSASARRRAHGRSHRSIRRIFRERARPPRTYGSAPGADVVVEVVVGRPGGVLADLQHSDGRGAEVGARGGD